MTKKAQYDGENVEFIRFANKHDPGFNEFASYPQALIRDGEEVKHVVPASDLMLAMDQAEEPGATTIKQSPPPEKGGKTKRRKGEE